MNIIRKVAAYILLVGVYGFTYVAALLGSIIPRRRWKPTGRIMVTGTFHNPNWYLSHITPLARSGLEEVILVVDEPQLPLERVRFVCPPRWVSRLVSRAGAKVIWMIIAGIRYRPDLYMGYHVTPGACTALVAGKLLGRPACYQMGGGPVEIVGGGFKAGDGFGRFLGRPSRRIESMALAIVSLFELVVVRGSRAKEYLETQNIRGSIAVITGSVNGGFQSPQPDRQIDLVFVGRLAPVKQPDQFIEIVEAASCEMPAVRATIVGDGPLMAKMKAKSSRLRLNNIEFLGKIEDVKPVLACSKVFVLTSQSEGLSIAMIEAMAVGTVPVVADVGELGDLVIDGVNGYLVEPNNIDEYTKRITSLLQDHALWTQYSRKAIEAARKHCDVAVVSMKWQQNLREVVSRASGLNTRKAMN